MRCPAILLLAATLAAAETAVPELKLDALPTQVTRNTVLQFENGKLHGHQDAVDVTLEAKLPDGQRVVGVESVEVLEAVGEGGVALQHDPDNPGSGSSGNDAASLSLTANLFPPPPGVRSLQRLVVAASVSTAAPGLRRAVLKPAKAWIAKRMRVDGYAGGEVELEDLGADRLSLGMTPALLKDVENLAFRTAAGDEIQPDNWNDDNQPGWVVRQVQVALPADGQIVLDLRQGAGRHRVILTATGIPLAPPVRVSTPGGVLPTVPVEGGPLEPGPQPAPAELKPADAKPGF